MAKRGILLLGASGMLGRAFVERTARRGVAALPLGRPAFDLSRPETLEALPWGEGDVVVCTAAWTDVDGAEAHEAAALAVNAEGPARLAELCKRHGKRLVQFSTDYVFDGRGTEPYAVDHPRAPISAYGRTKAAGEVAIEESGADFLLLRTSWLYAPWGKNFVRTMAALGRTKESLRVVDDQRGRPTSAEALAETTLDLLAAGARGILHACDGGECTWYELARAVIAEVAPACRVEPCTTAEFPRPAPRPAYSVLDLGPTEAILGRPATPWREALADVLPRLE
jgi:dTDP-4-dehydrorhamnose reductase